MRSSLRAAARKSTCLLGLLLLTGSLPASAAPWRLAEALDLPKAVALAGSYRLRYEHLDGQYRAGGGGSDQLLVERLWLAAEVDVGGPYAGAELADARSQLEDAGTPLGTDDVNALEPQQAYLGLRLRDPFARGDLLDLRAGRQTLDLGSRRLVARNQFRNTPNAFTGLVVRWTSAALDQWTTFYTLPLERRPFDIEDLADDEPALDREHTGQRFWGTDWVGQWEGVGRVEVYLLGLNEDDDVGTPPRARDLYTPGVRLWRDPAPGAIDYELENVLQFGRSRGAARDPLRRLDHLAHFHHAALGYTRDDAWRSRLVLQYDYASGDRDPADGDNGRFDTLFGARRGEFGPTGIHGPILRSNVNAPGVRFETAPAERLSSIIAYRAVFLAAARDAWIPAAVRDPSGAAGHFVGHQVEVTLVYEALPGNLVWDGGFAWLLDGRFQREAPNATGEHGTFYAYSQFTFRF